MQDLEELRHRLPQVGRVVSIGIARERRGEIEQVDEAEVAVGTGIVGEHHANGGHSERQVTLIQAEHLPVVAALVGRPAVDSKLLRRNVVVAGINLLALKKERFRIGDVLFEGTGPCVPCTLMETNLGPGGFNAMRGHGGINAVVLEAGIIRVGDPVRAAFGERTKTDTQSM